MLGRRQQPLLVGKAIQIGRGHRPAVALVLDKGVHDPDRATLVTLDELDAAEQRRRIGKACNLGEEPAHFDLGIGATFKLAVNLDHVVVIHQRRAVGLFGFDRTDTLGLPDRSVGKFAGRPEFEAQAVFFDGQDLAQIAQ